VALNPLQERIALLAAGLATDHGFALVGGAALNVLEVIDRRTQDLDYFHPLHDTAVARYGDALEAVLRDEGLDVHVIRRSNIFRRYNVFDGQWATDIDVALEPQLYPAVATRYGPVLELIELGVNKLLAAFSRYEPRDLVDLAAITRHVPFERLLELAPRKDAAFASDVLAHALGVTASRPAAEWGVDSATYERVLIAVHDWQRTLDARI
jgi:Nucleotidyl transferase AbiEii toxin, Type IV TA system